MNETDTYPFVFIGCVVSRIDATAKDETDKGKSPSELVREFETGVNEILTRLSETMGYAPATMRYREEIELYQPDGGTRIDTVVEVDRDAAQGAWRQFYAGHHNHLVPIEQYIAQARKHLHPDTVKRYENYPPVMDWLGH